MTRLAMRTYSLDKEKGYGREKANADFDYVNESPTDSVAAASAVSTGLTSFGGLIWVRRDGKPLPHIVDDAYNERLSYEHAQQVARYLADLRM
jgi:alkaline phosphatase